MNRVKVLIPFYKDHAKLARCQTHLDESVFREWVAEVGDDSETGEGFTKNVNKLMKNSLLSGYDYFIVLNQDCYLKPEAVGEMVAFMDKVPKCAFGSVKQTMEDGDRITHGGTLECFPSGVHEGGFVSKGDCKKSKKVPWVNGACFIARVSAILEIGLMDPNFKMFGSDSDWSYRARAFGWECFYIAKALCVHEQGASKDTGKDAQRLIENDMRYFRDKWLTGEVFKDLSLEAFK